MENIFHIFDIYKNFLQFLPAIFAKKKEFFFRCSLTNETRLRVTFRVDLEIDTDYIVNYAKLWFINYSVRVGILGNY